MTKKATKKVAKKSREGTKSKRGLANATKGGETPTQNNKTNPKPKLEGLTVGLHYLMQRFNISRPTVTAWTQKGIFKRIDRDVYDLDKCIEGYVAWASQKVDGKPELEKAKLRAEIRLREIRIAREQAESIVLSEVEALLVRFTSGIRTAAYAELVDRLRAEGPGKDAAAIGKLSTECVDAFLNRCRNQAAEWVTGQQQMAAAINKQISDTRPKSDEDEGDGDVD